MAEKMHVLVVDDEPHILNLIRLSLKSEEFRVTGAHSAREALEQLSKETPDLIILDIMMPGINGYQLCKSVRENANTKDTPIMILSAKTQMDDKLQAIDVGADDYITKPFDPMELQKRVRINLNLVS